MRDAHGVLCIRERHVDARLGRDAASTGEEPLSTSSSDGCAKGDCHAMREAKTVCQEEERRENLLPISTTS
jgi:hypothetical protein